MVEAEADEPRLKYGRLGTDVEDFLSKDAATCMCVSSRVLAVGTRSGTIHILDYNGDQVQQASAYAHRTPVLCLCQQ